MRVLCLIERSSQPSQGDITGDGHVYLASEKRLLSASVTLHVRIRTGTPTRTDTHARTHKGALLNSHAPTPSPARPGRRACLCQQMSGRRCVFLCLSLRSFHLLLQRLPICLRPRFISSHSSPPPTTNHHPRGQQRVCCVSDTLALFIPKTRFSQPALPSPAPQRRTQPDPQKVL